MKITKFISNRGRTCDGCWGPIEPLAVAGLVELPDSENGKEIWCADCVFAEEADPS